MARKRVAVPCSNCGDEAAMVVVFVQDWTTEPYCWPCLIALVKEVADQIDRQLAETANRQE